MAARSLTLLLIAALLAAGCAPTVLRPADVPRSKGRIRVRMVAHNETVPDARIEASSYPGAQLEETVYRAVTAPDGFADLVLPPGSYYLTAHSADGAFFGYYGPNPVELRSGEELRLVIPGLDGNEPPRRQAAPEGRLQGRAVADASPLPGARVAFYLDPSTQFRGPAYIEVETDGEGSFETPITAGRYFLLVRKRSGEPSSVGPMRRGDYFGYYSGNPVYVGFSEEVTVQIGALRVQQRLGWKEPSKLRTLLSGVIRDGKGRPLPGYRAFLHGSPEMLGRPDYVSPPSAADGRYGIWVDRPGRFYLGARREIGRAREAGETVGLYTGSPDHSVDVDLEGKEMIGLEIVVDEKEGAEP